MSSTDVAEHSAVKIQRAYYAATAANYDDMHLHADDEHHLALRFMISMLPQLGVRSILDVGSGTGRGLMKLKSEAPGVRAVGIEPSAELRAVGHAKGLSAEELIDGDAQHLAFPDRSFDLVCEFGALHHIPNPTRAVAEMLRVARVAVFISDSNNFGQGGRMARFAKQTLNTLGLWQLVDRVKTGGKGYTISEGDGLGYSYSVFNDLAQIRAKCERVHLLGTRDSGANLYRTAPQVALLGMKNGIVAG